MAGLEIRPTPDVSWKACKLRQFFPLSRADGQRALRTGNDSPDHILFHIAAGAFHVTRPSDLIPELRAVCPCRWNLHYAEGRGCQSASWTEPKLTR